MTHRYRISFASPWGHAGSQILSPEDPHTGNVLLVLHDAQYKMFKVGDFASPGLIKSAESGQVDLLQKEAEKHGRHIHSISSSGIIPLPGSKTWAVETKEPNLLLSWSAMLAPSADMFTGVSSFPLGSLKKGTSTSIPLYALNVGSDYGDEFRTEPKQHRQKLVPIHVQKGAPFFTDERPIPIGLLSIEAF